MPDVVGEQEWTHLALRLHVHVVFGDLEKYVVYMQGMVGWSNIV